MASVKFLFVVAVVVLPGLLSGEQCKPDTLRPCRGGSRKNIRGALAIESIIMYYKQMRHVLKNEILIVDDIK